MSKCSVFFVLPRLIVDRWLSQLDAGNPLNLFKIHHIGRQPRPFPKSHEQVCLDVPYEVETRSGLSSLQKEGGTMFNELSTN